jgi:hypothetical protein
VTSALVAACTSLPDDEETTGTTRAALAASELTPLAMVYVEGKGALEVETDYLPQVVCCENGGAPPEALKAQAVMARTYMVHSYFASDKGTEAKPFKGTTADQAYSCGRPTTDKCREAVAATAGQITSYTNSKGVPSINLAFFVDGPRAACLATKDCKCPKPSPTTEMSPDNHPPDCDCFTFASLGIANPAYVTYNWSETNPTINRSPIGSKTNEDNRGCGSQNIQSCLSYAGWDYRDMLRFFYGQDMTLRTLDGVEVTPDGGAPTTLPPPTTTPSPPREENADPGEAPPANAALTDESAGCTFAPRSPSHEGGPLGLPHAASTLAVLGLLAVRRRARA